MRMKAFMSVLCNTRQNPEPPRTSVPEKQDFNCRCGLQPLPTATIFGPDNSLHHCQKFRPELSVSGFGTTTLGVENNVERGMDFSAGSAKYFPEQALHTVSDHSASDLARNRNSQTVMAQGISLGKQHKSFRMKLQAAIVDGPVFGTSHDAIMPRKSLPDFPNHSLSAFFAPWRAAVSAPAGHPWLPF